MHYQSYDDEEFEPRIIPKPITKLDVSRFYQQYLVCCSLMYVQFKDIKEI